MVVDEIDEDQTVVDDHAGQRDDAEDADHADGEAEDEVSEHRTDDPERNHRHDQQRLDVGAQRNGDQRVDHEQREDRAQDQLTGDVLQRAGLARKAYIDPGVSGQDLGQDVLAQVADDRAGLGQFLVDPCGDADRALAVVAADGRWTGAFDDLGHRAERDLVAGRRADPHVLEVFLGGPLLARVADHDADVVLAALDALDFLAEEGLTDLPAQRLLAQAQDLGFRFDPDLQLAQATLEAVADVVGALELADRGLQFGRGRGQLTDVAADELERDVRTVAAGPARPADLQRTSADDLAGLLAPAPFDVGHAQAWIVGLVQFDQEIAGGLRTCPHIAGANDGTVEVELLLHLPVDPRKRL